MTMVLGMMHDAEALPRAKQGVLRIKARTRARQKHDRH